MFNFMQIQTECMLSDTEVCEINYIIKTRARRYVAAARKEWLYPERHIPTEFWDKLDDGYLLMPDPRSVTFSTEIIIGYKDNRSDAFDEYGRKPWQKGYGDKDRQEQEIATLHAFQGEFARVFGPKRRGVSFEFGSKTNPVDSPEYHAYHLRMEGKFKPAKANRGRRR
jgi:hypothetical protein